MPEEDAETAVQIPDPDAIRPGTAGELAASGSGGELWKIGGAAGEAGFVVDDGTPIYISGGEVEAIGHGESGEVGVTGHVDPKPDEEDE